MRYQNDGLVFNSDRMITLAYSVCLSRTMDMQHRCPAVVRLLKHGCLMLGILFCRRRWPLLAVLLVFLSHLSPISSDGVGRQRSGRSLKMHVPFGTSYCYSRLNRVLRVFGCNHLNNLHFSAADNLRCEQLFTTF